MGAIDSGVPLFTPCQANPPGHLMASFHSCQCSAVAFTAHSCGDMGRYDLSSLSLFSS